MILKALFDYYERKVALPDSEMAPPGWEKKDIHFVVVLSRDGQPVEVKDTREPDAKNKLRAKRFLVPLGVKKTSGVVSNLLWDNIEYTLGIARGDDGNQDAEEVEKVASRHRSFIERVAQIGCNDDPGISALTKFLAQPNLQSVLSSVPGFGTLVGEPNSNVSFKLAGSEGLLCDSEAVRDIVNARAQNSDKQAKGLCLVTGQVAPLERLHPAIKGVRNAQSSGANIVSFNAEAFCSYGKEQGDNAPISEAAVFRYVTAINDLLGSPRHKLQVGDATTVFWASRPSVLEERFRDMFDEPPKDNPSSGVDAVRAVYSSIEAGSLIANRSDDRFFVLGLSPNAGRISVRFWLAESPVVLANRMRQHFDDLAIQGRDGDPELLSLFRLLVSTAALGEQENIPPNLAGEVMRSILTGLPYPRSLLGAVVRRIRAEQAGASVTYPRAALLKACLNREIRYFKKEDKEVQMSLDETNDNIGYCLGRLFAVLEKIQDEGNGGSTIRDRFYGAASGTPVAVFGSLMRMKNHHLAKIQAEGRRVYFERLLGEILDKVSEFPGHLGLNDQGRFAIGYYHQNRKFYERRSVPESAVTTAADVAANVKKE